MVINGKECSPRITNSVIIRYCEQNGIALSDLAKVMSTVSYSFAAGLFVYAAKKEGKEVSMDDIDNELDNRIEFLNDLVLYVAQQLAPGEDLPGKTRPQRKKAAA